MQKRLNLLVIGLPLALASLVSACTPSIDVSGLQAFERSLAKAKGSMSQTDRSKLENAIFALVMDGAVLRPPGEWPGGRQHGWYISGTRDDISIAGHAGFVHAFWDAMFDGNPSFEKKTTSIMDKAIRKGLNIDDPIHDVETRLLANEQKELQKIVDRDREVVTTSFECTGVHLTYSIKNESKWPITGINFSYEVVAADQLHVESHESVHEFNPPLLPGGTSDIVLDRVAPSMTPIVLIPAGCQRPFLEQVSVVGRDPFAPLDRTELLKAKENFASLLQAEAGISRELQELLDWLIDIH